MRRCRREGRHLPGPPGIPLPQRSEDVRHRAAAGSQAVADADDVHGNTEVERLAKLAIKRASKHGKTENPHCGGLFVGQS
jgi:hypothetical protein